MARTSIPSSSRGAARRQRLVNAAADQFHRGGLHATALADVARAAEVPPGNMFYYFRTKDALSQAVVTDWTERVERSLVEIDAQSGEPRHRLALFLDRLESRGPTYALHGCPLAGLARDLRQQAIDPVLAAAPFERLLGWLEAQLATAGDREPTVHARFILAAIQGAYVLAHASGEAAVVGDVRRCIDAWLEGDLPSGLR